MARLIVIIPLLLLAGFRIWSWYLKRKTAQRQAQIVQARATIARHEAREAAANAPTIFPTEHGLVPRAELVVAGSEQSDEVRAALDAARTGDWRPAAAYLTEGGTDWDRRWFGLRPFTDLAVEDDGWLQAWRKEQPDSPEAALLQVDALIGVAWAIRSGERASKVSREQFEGFHRVLREAEEAAQEAVRLARAGDPNPWVVQIPIAMGLGWSNDRFRELWAELTARDPHNWAGHSRALQYWCAKWRGSHEQMHAFIDTAIASAPAGSLLAAMKIEAYFEQFNQDKEPVSAYQRAEVGTALDAALADLAAADPAHLRIDHTRGWLAYGLTKNGRAAEAVEQFRALGTVIPAPWAGFYKPVDSFVGLRIDAVLAATAEEA